MNSIRHSKFVSKWIFLYVIIFINLYLSNESSGQSPTVIWSERFGGMNYDYGYAVAQTTDGGFVVVGSTGSFGAVNNDIYLFKTDSNGNLVWQKTIGDSGFQYGHDIKKTFDDGFIITGRKTPAHASSTSDFDIWLIKTNSTGDSLWTKTYGGEEEDGATCVEQTSDSGYVLTGYSRSNGAGNLLLIKTNSQGEILWQKTFANGLSSSGNSVKQTVDGGYIVTGKINNRLPYSDKSIESNMWLLRTNANGDTIWTKQYGNTGDDTGNSVLQCNDRGFLIAGKTEQSVNENINRINLLKTDTLGIEQWSKTIGDFGGAHYIAPTSDNGYIICGVGGFEGGGSVTFAMKTDAAGNTIWNMTMPKQQYDYGSSVIETFDGDYVLVGGYSGRSGDGYMDAWLMRLSEISTGVLVTPKISSYKLYQNYPNPFNCSTKIIYEISRNDHVQLLVYNSRGQLVKKLIDNYQSVGRHVASWDRTDDNGFAVPSGLYFYKILLTNEVETKKAVLLK